MAHLQRKTTNRERTFTFTVEITGYTQRACMDRKDWYESKMEGEGDKNMLVSQKMEN